MTALYERARDASAQGPGFALGGPAYSGNYTMAIIQWKLYNGIYTMGIIQWELYNGNYTMGIIDSCLYYLPAFSTHLVSEPIMLLLKNKIIILIHITEQTSVQRISTTAE